MKSLLSIIKTYFHYSKSFQNCLYLNNSANQTTHRLRFLSYRSVEKILFFPRYLKEQVPSKIKT